MKVLIRRVCNHWALTIETSDQVLFAWPFQRAIFALRMAELLQMHVDNKNEIFNKGVSK